MMIWEQSRQSINHADNVCAWYLSLFSMAWHDKFKLYGSANFLFHFSLERYRNWILSLFMLQSIDWQSSWFHFIIFHHRTKMKWSKGCASWKSNRTNGLFIPFGRKTIYMCRTIDDNIFLFNCEFKKKNRNDSLWIKRMLNQ